MDLSWCIICDNRIDDMVTESSLYCSASCQTRDQSYSSVTGCHDQSNSNNSNNALSQSLGSLKNLVRLNKIGSGLPTPSPSSSSRTKRLNGASTSYPWELLYTRPRNKRHVVVKRCQPMVSSSYTTATAMFTANPSMV
ncbi:hypothetical protein BCR42DRAFT_416804 [Absidia repens]|uniref:Uncharacterized protein n=1 Tax=Absidia repens TaxID=90262 RepID=A0A1X2IF00_9FUNG|nr:hypothetical protein BCR42DRAFT_416804 [Absidia repens]